MNYWETILRKNYITRHINDEELVEEAIATCENIFELMDLDELCKRSRPLAISYLALKYVKRNK